MLQTSPLWVSHDEFDETIRESYVTSGWIILFGLRLPYPYLKGAQASEKSVDLALCSFLSTSYASQELVSSLLSCTGGYSTGITVWLGLSIVIVKGLTGSVLWVP